MRKCVILILLLLFLLCGCEKKQTSDSSLVTAVPTAAENHYFAPSASDHGGKRVFDLTPEAFRGFFNSVSDIELPNLADCEHDELPPCAHFPSGVQRYILKTVPDMQNCPSITLYTPVGSDDICEVTIDFDDHAFSESVLELYKELCLDVFGMFTSFDDPEKVFLELSTYADENISAVNFLDSDKRDILFTGGSAAFFSYFSYGEYSHICISPVS